MENLDGKTSIYDMKWGAHTLGTFLFLLLDFYAWHWLLKTRLVPKLGPVSPCIKSFICFIEFLCIKSGIG
jgi:hypothetical protein